MFQDTNDVQVILLIFGWTGHWSHWSLQRVWLIRALAKRTSPVGCILAEINRYKLAYKCDPLDHKQHYSLQHRPHGVEA